MVDKKIVAERKKLADIARWLFDNGYEYKFSKTFGDGAEISYDSKEAKEKRPPPTKY